MASYFAHLHLHSNYSLLAGTSSIKRLIDKAASFGMPALALTDTNNLYGAIPFYKLAKERGLKPIIGAEIEYQGEKAVLLARKREGYANICRIITKRNLSKDFFLKKNLIKHGDDLYILSEDVPLLQSIAKERGTRYLYAELISYRDNSTLARQARLRSVFDAARKAKLKMVATNDVYMAERKEHRLHKVLRAIKENTLLSKVAPEKICHPEAYFKSPEEMAALFKDYPQVLANTKRIVEECNLDLGLGKVVFPEYPLPEGETAHSFLYKLSFQDLKEKYSPITPEAIKRLNYELEVINKLGFSEYFIIVWDIVNFAQRQNIPIMGRGSAASSLVTYCLGITNVDPLKYDLYFERFLNLSRSDLPDIDLDLCWRRRDEVIDYVYEKYGPNRVAMISTHNTFQGRSAFREVAKVFGVANDIVNRLSRRIPYSGAKNLSRIIRSAPECRGFPLNKEPFKTILKITPQLDGFPRHLSIHCGGIVICPTGLTNYFPLEEATKGIVISQFEMNAVGDMGLVKIDLLGHRALSVIQETLKWIKENRGIELNIDKIPDKDPETIKLLRTGRTLSCGQIESPAMRNLMQMLNTSCIDELIAALALVRPGPSGIGMKELYIKRARGEEETTAVHPIMADLLKDTYGVMLYQEDILRVAHQVAGFTLEEGDELRKAISKERSEEKMKEIEGHFLKKAAGRGITFDAAKKIWRQIANFASYAFCKAHAATYGILAYQGAYLKAHYPLEYMTSVMNNHMGMYARSAHLAEARRLGLKILLPDINKSDFEYTVEDGAMRIGLIQVRSLSIRAIESILKERKKREFCSLNDFLTRTHIGKKEVENLILCGALDSLGTRPELLWELERVFRQKRPSAEALLTNISYKSSSARFPDYDVEKKLQQEMELLNLYVSCHPLEAFRKHLKMDGFVRSPKLREHINEDVRTLGLLIAVRKTPTKSNKIMEFLTLEDEEGIFEVTLFPREYQRYGHRIRSVGPYIVEGKVESQSGAVTLTAKKVSLLDEVRQSFPVPERNL